MKNKKSILLGVIILGLTLAVAGIVTKEPSLRKGQMLADITAPELCGVHCEEVYDYGVKNYWLNDGSLKIGSIEPMEEAQEFIEFPDRIQIWNKLISPNNKCSNTGNLNSRKCQIYDLYSQSWLICLDPKIQKSNFYPVCFVNLISEQATVINGTLFTIPKALVAKKIIETVEGEENKSLIVIPPNLDPLRIYVSEDTAIWKWETVNKKQIKVSASWEDIKELSSVKITGYVISYPNSPSYKYYQATNIEILSSRIIPRQPNPLIPVTTTTIPITTTTTRLIPVPTTKPVPR